MTTKYLKKYTHTPKNYRPKLRLSNKNSLAQIILSYDLAPSYLYDNIQKKTHRKIILLRNPNTALHFYLLVKLGVIIARSPAGADWRRVRIPPHHVEIVAKIIRNAARWKWRGAFCTRGCMLILIPYFSGAGMQLKAARAWGLRLERLSLFYFFLVCRA